jgi:RNA 3'-terminal phosphate cyclase (ATP)
MLTLDGSYGEGGGQILRTALALAVAVQQPVRLTRIRARRDKPGLRPQHLTAVRALAAVSDAAVQGAELGAAEVTFVPRGLRGGDWTFDVGTAGAVSLVFQALLLPLAFSAAPSRVRLIGGTHVRASPPFEYLTEVFLPALAQVGVRAGLTLVRRGWHPRGGGEIAAAITPLRRAALGAFVAEARAEPLALRGVSAVSRLPRSIAERQRQRAEERLAAAGLTAEIAVAEDREALGAGTSIFLGCRGRAGFSALGRRGLPAERVADLAVDDALSWLGSGAALDGHLADQLVPFLGLSARTSLFTCPAPSAHLATVAWVVQQFVPVEIALEGARPCRVRITPRVPRSPAERGPGRA